MNNFIDKLSCAIITSGRIPRHVVFVADGARRFGKKHRIPVRENHEIGLHRVMVDLMDWCLELGVKEYSVLMYSLMNYRRPSSEVGHWVLLWRTWLKKMIGNWKWLRDRGIRFFIFGELSLIPDDINALMAVLMLITKDNKKLTVTYAMGYTGRHELSTVAFELFGCVKNNLTCKNYLCQKLADRCLFNYDSYPADLMIRTSGHKRISDYYPWQVSESCFYFSPVLWPEFSKREFYIGIFLYQHSFGKYSKNSIPPFQKFDKYFSEKLVGERTFGLMKYAIDSNLLPRMQFKELYQLRAENISKFARQK